MSASIRPTSATDVDPATQPGPADPAAMAAGFGQMLKSRIAGDGKADDKGGGKGEPADVPSGPAVDGKSAADAPVDTSALAAWAATLAQSTPRTGAAEATAATVGAGTSGRAASAAALAGVADPMDPGRGARLDHPEPVVDTAATPTVVPASPVAVTDAVADDAGKALAALSGPASRGPAPGKIAGAGAPGTNTVSAATATPDARVTDNTDALAWRDAQAAASPDAPQSGASVANGIGLPTAPAKDAATGKLGDLQAIVTPNHQTSDAVATLTTAGLGSTPAIAASVDPSPASGTLAPAVGTAAWSHDLGQVTVRMAAGDLQNASLRLNPEHLGPIDVQVRVDNGVANLSFNAAHAETRQAIEGSRAVLDQMFAQQGLTVGDCSVGDSQRQSGQPTWADAQPRAPGRDQAAMPTGADVAPAAPVAAVRATSGTGRVDIFA